MMDARYIRLAKGAGVSQREAAQLVKKFREAFPAAAKIMAAMRSGYVVVDLAAIRANGTLHVGNRAPHYDGPLRCWSLGGGNQGYGHESRERVTAFNAALDELCRHLPAAQWPTCTAAADYEYVCVVRLADYKQFWSGNGGAQGWWHRATGYTVPDYCRLTGGCPDMWNRTRRRQRTVSADSPIRDWLTQH